MKEMTNREVYDLLDKIWKNEKNREGLFCWIRDNCVVLETDGKTKIYLSSQLRFDEDLKTMVVKDGVDEFYKNATL